MRWTLWQRRTTCTTCGAKLSVPESGLTMLCQFCENEQAVPDIEERRKRLRKTITLTPDANARAMLERELQRSEAFAIRAEVAAARTRALRNMLVLGGTVALIGLGLHISGLWRSVSDYYQGDDGRKQLQRARRRLGRLDRYRATGGIKIERAFASTRKLYVGLSPKHCYAILLGAGKPIERVVLRDPARKVVKKHATMRFYDILLLCPKHEGAHTLEVDLAEPGRFSWALHRRPKSKTQ